MAANPLKQQFKKGFSKCSQEAVKLLRTHLSSDDGLTKNIMPIVQEGIYKEIVTRRPTLKGKQVKVI